LSRSIFCCSSAMVACWSSICCCRNGTRFTYSLRRVLSLGVSCVSVWMTHHFGDLVSTWGICDGLLHGLQSGRWEVVAVVAAAGRCTWGATGGGGRALVRHSGRVNVHVVAHGMRNVEPSGWLAYSARGWKGCAGRLWEGRGDWG
jgi:hypothetical protein